MEKNYNTHNFIVGDEVWHPIRGKGKVKKVDKGYSPVWVEFESGVTTWFGAELPLLSFTPYEIPSNWERLWEPKDGDIISSGNFYCSWVSIFKEWRNSQGHYRYYASLIGDDNLIINNYCSPMKDITPASDVEKEKLFDALAKEGNRWNAEKKELENIPEPLKAGDLVIAYNKEVPKEAFIIYYENILVPFDVVVKFKSMEQYEKIRRGEV